MTKKGWIIMGLITNLLSGCHRQALSDYQHETPQLILEQYLSGRIEGVGLIQDWSGTVRSRFNFTADARWHDGTCTFDEHMRYIHGKKDHRIWTIKKIQSGHYQGTTQGVVGHADILVSGNAMHWTYTMDVDINNRSVRLNFDDWMFLMDNHQLININQFKKLGIPVGRLTLYMNKVSA